MPTADDHPDVRRLRRRAEATDRQYKQHFAGHPRLTRNPALLDAMLAEVDEALAMLDDLAPAAAGREAVEAELRRQRDLYLGEDEAIRQAQAAGPGAWEAHRLTTWAGLVGARYRRHFAGHSRLTRDAPLLEEIRADSTRLKAEIDSAVDAGRVDAPRVAKALEALTQDLGLYTAEAERIRQAHHETLETDPKQVASALAKVANDQFALYAAHFAGQPRSSRRPALLERMIGALQGTRTRMDSLRAGGLESERNAANIPIVEGRLAVWRKELSAIQEAKRGAALSEIVAALGAAANALFDRYQGEYAGHSRATRDLDPLGVVSDGLYDLARQMDEIDRMLGDPGNRRNLGAVLENLRMYEAEWEAIRKARR